MLLNARRIVISAVLAAAASIVPAQALAQSAPDFPELTGQVVDSANMLPAKVEARLNERLAAHEEATTEQVVVVTMPNLQGRPIEEFGYQLGRHWGIGQAGEDNGALLIVAEEERRIRIEVGYGLEGRLTDAASATIINQVITPAFRAGDIPTGIVNGAEAMLEVLGGKVLAVPQTRPSGENKPHPALAILFFTIVIISFFGGMGGGRSRSRSALLGGLAAGAMMGGRGGGGFGGGGFSGGGGGFGGGGASGGW